MRPPLVAILVVAAALPWVPVHAQFLKIPPPDWAVGVPAHDPPISPIPNWYLVRGGTWELPPATLQELLTLIDAKISVNPLFGDKARIARYAIQFRGETSAGRRIVRLAGACSMKDTPAWELSAQLMRVQDGGKCFFDAEYDPEARRLSYFSYHGHA